MRQDHRLRAAARAVYDACFPTEDIAPVGFDDAEKYGTIHYRRAVEAARDCLRAATSEGDQLRLL